MHERKASYVGIVLGLFVGKDGARGGLEGAVAPFNFKIYYHIE